MVCMFAFQISIFSSYVPGYVIDKGSFLYHIYRRHFLAGIMRTISVQMRSITNPTFILFCSVILPTTRNSNTLYPTTSSLSRFVVIIISMPSFFFPKRRRFKSFFTLIHILIFIFILPTSS